MMVVEIFILYQIRGNSMNSIYMLVLIVYHYIKLYGWTLDEFWKLLEFISRQENKMKYVMVDKTDSIVSVVTLDNNLGVKEAKIYFMKMKRLPEEEFDKIWRVMSSIRYDRQFEVGHRKPSSHPGYIEWWKDESKNLDIEKE